MIEKMGKDNTQRSKTGLLALSFWLEQRRTRMVFLAKSQEPKPKSPARGLRSSAALADRRVAFGSGEKAAHGPDAQKGTHRHAGQRPAPAGAGGNGRHRADGKCREHESKSRLNGECSAHVTFVGDFADDR